MALDKTSVDNFCELIVAKRAAVNLLSINTPLVGLVGILMVR